MKPLWDEAFWNVTINWSKPMTYESLMSNGSQYDEEAHLYLISGKYSTFPHKPFYIGKTYNQFVSKRLKQKDHKKRLKELQENRPNHTLYVSHGIVQIYSGTKIAKRNSKRIDEIERLLIYTMPVEHTINKRNYFTHGVTEQYLIENKGYYCGIPKQFSLGVFS